MTLAIESSLKPISFSKRSSLAFSSAEYFESKFIVDKYSIRLEYSPTENDFPSAVTYFLSSSALNAFESGRITAFKSWRLKLVLGPFLVLNSTFQQVFAFYKPPYFYFNLIYIIYYRLYNINVKKFFKSIYNKLYKNIQNKLFLLYNTVRWYLCGFYLFLKERDHLWKKLLTAVLIIVSVLLIKEM